MTVTLLYNALTGQNPHGSGSKSNYSRVSSIEVVKVCNRSQSVWLAIYNLRGSNVRKSSSLKKVPVVARLTTSFS